MGQKANPNILRLGITKNWKTEFFEKKKKELPLYIFNDLEIQRYIERFLRMKGIFIHDCRQFYSNQVLNLYVSYFVSSTSIFNVSEKSKQIMLKKSTGEMKVINYTKNKSLRYMLKVISNFTKHKFDIIITFSCINKDFKHFSIFKAKKIRMLRRFKNTPFFQDGLELLFHVSFNKNSARLLAEFVADQLKKTKRLNFFLVFVKQALKILILSDFSKLKGIKIMLKGRLRKNLRATQKTLTVGDVAVQTLDSNIDYHQTTTHNSNGSYGIKVWIVEK